MPVAPGGSYRVSFWIKTEGAAYAVSAGDVPAESGSREALASSTGATEAWRRFESKILVPECEGRLRFELSIRSPGQPWIDDVRTEAVDADSSGRT